VVAFDSVAAVFSEARASSRAARASDLAMEVSIHFLGPRIRSGAMPMGVHGANLGTG